MMRAGNSGVVETRERKSFGVMSCRVVSGQVMVESHLGSKTSQNPVRVVWTQVGIIILLVTLSIDRLKPS